MRVEEFPLSRLRWRLDSIKLDAASVLAGKFKALARPYEVNLYGRVRTVTAYDSRLGFVADVSAVNQCNYLKRYSFAVKMLNYGTHQI